MKIKRFILWIFCCILISLLLTTIIRSGRMDLSTMTNDEIRVLLTKIKQEINNRGIDRTPDIYKVLTLPEKKTVS